MVQVEANKNGPGCCRVKSLHFFFMANWVINADEDVLAADRTNDLPAVHARAKRHVRQHQVVLLLLFLFALVLHDV
jgi:hypothetical protein